MNAITSQTAPRARSARLVHARPCAWRSLLARRIVEIFLDPFSNPGAHWLPSGAVQARKEVADLLWRIAPEDVRRFAPIFREPDVDTWSRMAVVLAEAAEPAQPLRSDALVLSPLATAFRAAAATTVINEIIHGEHVGAAGTGGGKRHEAMSLNFPTFLEFLRQVDPILTGVCGICEVVHDETPQFDAAFASGVDTFVRVGQIDLCVGGRHALAAQQRPHSGVSDGRFEGRHRNPGR